MADYLFEIYGEEIPSRMQKNALKQVQELFHKELLGVHLTYARMEPLVTPRRLGVHIEGLPEKQPDHNEEKRGPRLDAAPKAIEAFAKSVGLTIGDLEQRSNKNGAFYFATFSHAGALLSHLLPGIVERVMRRFVWPKSMRWNQTQMSWVRPIHHGLSILNGEALPFQLDLGGGVCVSFGNVTRGHAMMAPDLFSVTTYADYQDRLRHRNVMLHHAQRMESIQSQIEALAAYYHLKVCADPGLLEEVAGMVEFPVPLLGKMDASYMDLPRELLITVMRHHQRYFALEDASGNLAPYFIVVANRTPEDGGAQILEGNHRVLRARFNDARFFYDQDRRRPLSEYNTKLSKMTFHADLGTMSDKVARMEELAEDLANHLHQNVAQCRRAAHLSKSDLCTSMVYEFPELQGIMGRYYANSEGLEVSRAIEEHYLPNSADSPLPQTDVGIVVALADKWDALVGFFGVGIQPTGSKDPYALRRTSLGIIRLMEQKQLYISMRMALLSALAVYAPTPFLKKDPTDALLEFLKDRLTIYWAEQGIRKDVVAALGEHLFEFPLHELRQRAVVLQVFCASPEGGNVLQGFARANSILQQQKTDVLVGNLDVVKPELLTFHAEKMLMDALMGVERNMVGANLEDSLKLLATLRHPIDGFFNTVIVNDPNPAVRTNRLALLDRIVRLMNEIADFRWIQA